jgi:peptidylprolyl isomerase
VPTPKRQRQKEARRARVEAQRRAQRRRQSLKRAGTTILGAVVVVGIVYVIVSGPSGSGNPPATTIPHTPAQLRVAQAKANELALKAGCTYEPPTASHPANHLHWAHPPRLRLNPNRTYYATMVTTQGTMRMWINNLTAPVNAANFVFLAEHHFYDCTPFHRVIPNFAVQGGDPTGTGTGGPGYHIYALEYPYAVQSPKQIEYPAGSVAMANSGLHTNGSQFFIVPAPLPLIALAPNYTIIGYVLGGREVMRVLSAEGKPGRNSTGVPPLVLNRVLSVTISSVNVKPVSPTAGEP